MRDSLVRERTITEVYIVHFQTAEDWSVLIAVIQLRFFSATGQFLGCRVRSRMDQNDSPVFSISMIYYNCLWDD